MMKPRHLAAAAAAAVLATSASAHAGMDTLDFESLGLGDLGTTTASLPDATITSGGVSLYDLSPFFFAGQGGAICALDATGHCEADMRIDFTTAVTNLTFQTVGWDPGDHVTIYAFDGSTLVAMRNVRSDKTVNLGNVGPITSLWFDDKSTGAGMGYGAFCFTPAVPEPASLGLLLAGLGVLGLKARRRGAEA